MTTSGEPPPGPEDRPSAGQQSPEENAPPQQAQPRQRAPRPPGERRSRRQEANPALDPRLVQLERRSRRPSKALDASLLAVGIAAFFVGVGLHFWVVSSILSSGDSPEPAITVPATPTVDDAEVDVPTPTAVPQPSPTPLPDRTDCEEIRGTQYRSVTEREFFLENCTS